MLLPILEIRKIKSSICVTNYAGMDIKTQMYYESLMISQVCEFEIPKIPREKNETPILRLALDEKNNEYHIYSSEDEKETIEILASAIIFNLMNV